MDEEMGVGMPSMGSGSGFGLQGGGRDIEGMEEGMQHEQGSGYGGEDGHADLVRSHEASSSFHLELMLDSFRCTATRRSIP